MRWRGRSTRPSAPNPGFTGTSARIAACQHAQRAPRSPRAPSASAIAPCCAFEREWWRHAGRQGGGDPLTVRPVGRPLLSTAEHPDRFARRRAARSDAGPPPPAARDARTRARASRTFDAVDQGADERRPNSHETGVMASFPKDRFDDLPPDLQRVGAHRAVPKGGRGWIAFAWAALASGRPGARGPVRYRLPRQRRPRSLPAGAPPRRRPPRRRPPRRSPITDPATIASRSALITITILNGTADPAIEAGCGGQARRMAGRHQVTAGRDLRTSRPPRSTTATPLNEDVARGVVLALGVGEIRLIDVTQMPSAAPVVLVLGIGLRRPSRGE